MCLLSPAKPDRLTATFIVNSSAKQNVNQTPPVILAVIVARRKNTTDVSRVRVSLNGPIKNAVRVLPRCATGFASAESAGVAHTKTQQAQSGRKAHEERRNPNEINRRDLLRNAAAVTLADAAPLRQGLADAHIQIKWALHV